MPGPRAADRPVILDANEKYPASPVGQAHHRLDKVAVVQPFPLLTLELDFIGLPASDPPRDTRGQVRCRVRLRLHKPAPFARRYATSLQRYRKVRITLRTRA